jgi:hypothetical protein
MTGMCTSRWSLCVLLCLAADKALALLGVLDRRLGVSTVQSLRTCQDKLPILRTLA